MLELSRLKLTSSLFQRYLPGLSANILGSNGSRNEVPRLLSNLVYRTRTFNSASAAESSSPAMDQRSSQETELPDHRMNDHTQDFKDEYVRLTLPSDINIIAATNPELADVIQAHEEHQRVENRGPKQQILDLLSQSTSGKSVKITKTALNRLRIDTLRQQLEALNADPRGNKSSLVERIMQLVKADEKNMSLTNATEALSSGLISRKDIVRQQRLQAQSGIDPHSTGVSEGDLRQSVRTATEEADQFAKVFKDPHEVARLMVDARADDICIIDVRSKCSFTDYMVLATTRSPQLMRDLAGGVLNEVKARCKEVVPGVMPAIEGGEDPQAEWLLVDAGNVLVHVFLESSRREYDLEGLWGDADTLQRVAPKSPINTLDSIKV